MTEGKISHRILTDTLCFHQSYIIRILECAQIKEPFGQAERSGV